MFVGSAWSLLCAECALLHSHPSCGWEGSPLPSTPLILQTGAPGGEGASSRSHSWWGQGGHSLLPALSSPGG